MIIIIVALIGAAFLCWTVREAWLMLLARPAQAQTSPAPSAIDLPKIALEGNVSGFSRSDGCAPGEDSTNCKVNTYYGWITMNCLNKVNNETVPTNYCPGLDSSSRQLARVIVCPLDDRGNALNQPPKPPTRYIGVTDIAGTALGLCIGRNQGDVVGYAYAGGVIQP